MSAVAVRPEEVEIVEGPTLDDLAETIKREMDLMRSDLESALEHGINVGKALMAARAHVPHGEWMDWTRRAGVSSSGHYIRLAYYEDVVGHLPTINEARRLVRGLPEVPTKKPERAWVVRIREMRESGLGPTAIARELGISRHCVWVALKPGQVDKQNVRVLAYNRSAREAARQVREDTKRAERDKAAKRAGGGVSELYSLIRKAAQVADGLGRDGASIEIRAAANEAIRDIHRAEDKIVRALGVS